MAKDRVSHHSYPPQTCLKMGVGRDGVGRVRWGSVGWIRLGKATKISFFLSYTSFFSFSEELYISGLGLE